MTTENLALTDQHGETALSLAAVVNNIAAAKILVNKNPDLPNISGRFGFPIHKAARFGHKDMVWYLLDVTKDDIESNPFMGDAGGHLLIDVIAADFYDIALILVGRYPETATVELVNVGSPLSVLAKKSTVFSSGRDATRWSCLFSCDTMRRNKEKKLKKRQALKLVKALCKEILELDDAKVFTLLQQPLHDAARLGIPEIIEEIVDAFPPAIWFIDKDNCNVFQLAVLNRQEDVFNLIYQMTSFRHLITSYTDPQENNMLHLVARLPPSDRLDLVSGPAFQFQREMQWYKEVEKFVQPAQRVAKNKEDKTPNMVFRKEHEQLMTQGVKWTKRTTSSATVFATLIATVAFAGGMHFPEGKTNGAQVIHYQEAFTTFVVADTISVVLSVLSIMIFLSIIISRHSEVEFLSNLPQRLYIGLALLFISINTLLLAFCAALYLLLGPTTAHRNIRLVMYASLILFVLVPLPILYPILWSINEGRRFKKKSLRRLH